MKKNVGTTDRVLRILLAVAVGILYFAGLVSGSLAAILGVVALLLVGTSFVGFCPLYAAINFTTKKSEKQV